MGLLLLLLLLVLRRLLPLPLLLLLLLLLLPLTLTTTTTTTIIILVLSLGHLGDFLGSLEAILRSSWGNLGLIWGPSEGCFSRCTAHLENGHYFYPFCGLLGAHLGDFRAAWRPSRGRLGATLGSSEAHLRAAFQGAQRTLKTDIIFILSGAFLGPSWGHLGPPWRHLGGNLRACSAILIS